MKIQKQAFLAAMKKALPGVEKGSSIIEGADTFAFSNEAIHSYNDSISVSVPFKFEKDVSGAIKSVDFFNLINKLPTDEITLESQEKIFKINSAQTEVEMVKIKNNISGNISTLNINTLEWEQLPDNFFQAIRLCKISCNRAPQKGIFVEGKSMYSTDIARVNYHKLSAEMDRFWIDDLAVVELIKIEGLTLYSISEAWAHFKGEDGTVFSCKRKDDSSYPVQKIQEVLEDHKMQKDEVGYTLPEGLYNVADRMSTLSSEMGELPAIRMTFNQDCIDFFSERYTGKIKEKLLFEKPLKDKIELQLWIDPYFLMEASRKVTGFFIKSTKVEDRKINTLVFYNDNYTQVVSTFAGNKR